MRVLVTGGAGYIGSVTARMLQDEGHEVLVADNLSRGHERACAGLALEVVDIESQDSISAACRGFEPEACVHFAARSLVGESMKAPLSYYRTNVLGTMNLLTGLFATECRRLVFSSSAAVYGEPETSPITERCSTEPVNPYGMTKLTVERMLAQLAGAGQVAYCSLRYFNAAGADVEHGLGEDHDPETHLIPNIVKAALGRAEAVGIFGTDYPTADGTCVRDYIHVLDLARAHVLALDALGEPGRGRVFNLGNGEGFSVREVIQAVNRVSGRSVQVREAARRPGDPPVLVASSDIIRRELAWESRLGGIDQIVESAWRWHSAHPDGYR